MQRRAADRHAVEERPAPRPRPPEQASDAARVLHLQRTVGNHAVATMVARQPAPAAPVADPPLEEVLEWPEKMPRADRTGKTQLTTKLTPGGKAEPQMQGVADVAGAGVDDLHRSWAAYIAKQRQTTPTKKLKVNQKGGWEYGGQSTSDADPTQLTNAPNQSDPKTKAQWLVWREMKNEGGASAINAWDKMGLSWGRGHASGFGNTADNPTGGRGVLPDVMARLVKDPDVARELKRYGIWWEKGNVWLAVNTQTASVEVGSSALSLIQGSRDILAALIKITEDTDPAHGNLHQKIVDAQWAEMAEHAAGDVPAFALGLDPSAPNGSNPWPDAVIQIVAHLTWGTPAIGWIKKNQDEYKATGGDLGKVLKLWARLRFALWTDKKVTNGAYLINDTQVMSEFRGWGGGAAARFLGANGSGPIDMSRDMARTAPELSGRLVLKNAFGDGYFVYDALSDDVVEKLGGSSRTAKLNWLNGQSMRRMIQELQEIKKKVGAGAFLYNWMDDDARATADRLLLNSPRIWFAMKSVRAGRPVTSDPGYGRLPAPQKAIAHDVFKVPRPKDLKDVDASGE